jgi:hypothetical protein
MATVEPWGLSEQKRKKRETREASERAARFEAAAKHAQVESDLRKAHYEKLEQDIKALRQLQLKARPPSLRDGDLRLLREMAGDFTAPEWTQYIDAPALEIERACEWLGVKARNE